MKKFRHNKSGGNKMKKMTAILMVMTVVLSAMTGCSPQPVENNDVGKEEENKIVMYTNAEFAPFEYFEGENIVGADVDIANEIAKDLGKELIVEHTDFDGIIPAIKSGKAHIGAAAMTITEARQEEVDFSIGYVTSIQNIIYKNDAELTTMEQLIGKKIGVQLGTTGDLKIDDAINLEDGALYNSGAELKTYSSAIEAAQDLLAGRVDAVVTDQLPAEQIVVNNPELGTVEFGDISESYGIAVKKGNKELLDSINKTLTRLLEEGKIEEYIANHSN
jgi:polar amino acid transport system substrate-binding protein